MLLLSNDKKLGYSFLGAGVMTYDYGVVKEKIKQPKYTGCFVKSQTVSYTALDKILVFPSNSHVFLLQ
jgi:hypothetical protein